MGLLQEENDKQGNSQILFLQTQFKELITLKGAAQVVVWQKEHHFHLVPLQQIFVPYHMPGHWALVVSISFLCPHEKKRHYKNFFTSFFYKQSKTTTIIIITSCYRLLTLLKNRSIIMILENQIVQEQSKICGKYLSTLSHFFIFMIKLFMNIFLPKILTIFQRIHE